MAIALRPPWAVSGSCSGPDWLERGGLALPRAGRLDDAARRPSAAAAHRADPAESAGTVLLVVSVASVVSLLGTVVELSAARMALSHLALALSTVVGSWLLLPTEFSLSYASIHYALPVPGGLGFPGAEPHFQPDYGDFLYVSMTIAVACQIADVTVTT